MKSGGAAALAAALAVLAPAQERLQVWRLGGRDDRARPVGSLQKPFVAEAWARAHPGQRPAAFTCTRDSRCWLPTGHGRLELTRATALSCNAFFLELARATPPELLAQVLRERGFVVREPLSPEGAIGLLAPEVNPVARASGAHATDVAAPPNPRGLLAPEVNPVARASGAHATDVAAPPNPRGLLDAGEAAITPQALLRSYRELTSTPWGQGEQVRLELLRGLREAALTGTAAGLGQRGYWAKTGTVPALDGQPLATSGWALALDDAGFAVLALLPRGTGRQAAKELGALLPRLRVGGEAPSADQAAPESEVRVRLLETLAAAGLRVRHLEAHPVSTSTGFVGPGAALPLSDGLTTGSALWELELPRLGLVRRVPGRLEVRGRRIVACMTPRQWLAGALQGESPAPDLRIEAAAALLRFLAQGPRHSDADLCDSTHCAYFVGAGPRLSWSDPRHARALPDLPPLTDDEWGRAQALARRPGPAAITSHCGGQPLSELYVWGRGSREVRACPRHRSGPTAAWQRPWPAEALRAAFGDRVVGLRVDDSQGTWRLQVETPSGRQRLSFDEAHRRLASALGWDALPSPASRLRPRGDGYLAEGVGRGHRVGLCLDGEPAAPVPPVVRGE